MTYQALDRYHDCTLLLSFTRTSSLRRESLLSESELGVSSGSLSRGWNDWGVRSMRIIFSSKSLFSVSICIARTTFCCC